MAAKETESERFWMRLPKTLGRQIEVRAKAEGLNKTDWVRNVITEALAPSSEIDFAIMDTLREMRARLGQSGGRDVVAREAERQFQKIHDEAITL